MTRRLTALGLCAALCLGAAGCSTAQSQINRRNASIYVQGVLDETYTGAPRAEYQTLVDHTQQQSEELFAGNLQAEYAQRLAKRFELDDRYVPRDLRRDYIQLLDRVYQHASYTVKTATPLEDGRYCVELSVTPVTFFAAAYSDGYAKLRREFEEENSYLTDEELEELEPAQARKEQEKREAAWARAVYDYLYARLDSVTTGPAVTKLVLVSPDNEGTYALSATDLQNIDDLILQY